MIGAKQLLATTHEKQSAVHNLQSQNEELKHAIADGTNLQVRLFATHALSMILNESWIFMVAMFFLVNCRN